MHAKIGDNSHELTPAETKALFMHHFDKVLKQTEICKAENAIRQKLRKEAKADGIILSDIDFGLRCAQIEDPQIIIDEQKRRAEIGRFFALPIGAQTDMDFDRMPAIDRARELGEAAGYASKNTDTVPYDENSDQGRAWLEGWKTGNMRLAEDFETAHQKKSASRNDADTAADDGENDPDNDDEPDEAA
jgi:ribosome modulation factor